MLGLFGEWGGFIFIGVVAAIAFMFFSGKEEAKAGGKGAAPDVDLRSRGVNNQQVAILALGLAAAAYHYSSIGAQEAPASVPEVQPSGGGIVSTLLWGIWRLFQLLVGMALLLLVWLVVKQRSILYVPTPPGAQRSPKDNPVQMRSPNCSPWNMEYESVMITTEDGVKVNAWFIYHKAAATSTAPYTIVYFHGNAGNIGFRLENLRDMHRYLKVNILILDYRAYGDSEDGDGPTEKGFMMDARASYRWLVDRIRNPPPGEPASMSVDRILLFGRSIGGVVALRLGALLLQERLDDIAAKRSLTPLPAGIVLENTFTSLRDMAVQVFPFLYYLKPVLRSPIIFDEWKGNEALDFMVKNEEHWCCCLLSGLKDTLVPPEQMASLHGLLKQRAPKVLKFFKFRDGGHNDTPMRGGAEYWNSFQKFMDCVVESETERKAHFAAQEKQNKQE